MTEGISEEPHTPDGSGDGKMKSVESPKGSSPYATGGGGVTFERKVAVQYLAHLLVGDFASELGEGRRVISVAFQQAPDNPVDDLVVRAARPDELQASLVLALAVRRSPSFVARDESTRKLVRQFVDAMANAPTDGPEHRMRLVVAGPQEHAKQLATLANHAAVQMDSAGFFGLIGTPGKFQAAVRGRLTQLDDLVERALHDVGGPNPNASLVKQRTWELLSRLDVSMPRLESPDETDWAAVASSLIPVARGSEPTAASQLRDRLIALASEYSPKSARVDLTLLRRDAHGMLDPTTRRNEKGWQMLDHLHGMALGAVRKEITRSDGCRVNLDRSGAAAELVATAAKAAAVVVSGESGVGKSALALLGITSGSSSDQFRLQVRCINLRHVPKLTVDFENKLGCRLSMLLSELSAPQRLLIVDAADAVAEGMSDAFRYLVDAADTSEMKVIAVTSVESQQVVRDALTERFGTEVMEHTVAPLNDAEVGEVVNAFTELRNLNAHPMSRELLRRLVVVDLLVRGRVDGVPLTDADAMKEVWSGLVRRREVSDRGSPDARELALLRLADLSLKGADRLDGLSGIDAAALDGLRRDGLLCTSADDPFMIGPEFAHDEVRRYAVARLLLSGLSGDTPAERILQAGAPRWSLSAAQLACQAWFQRPHAPKTPLAGRLSTLQESFDRLVKAGHGARWGDVPGEALLALADPQAVLRDAWPELVADDAVGLRRLARLVDQRLRDKNGIVDHIAVEPIITLLLEHTTPWRSGKYAEDLLRDWLRAHVVAKTRAGHPLRILLRERLIEACAAGDRRLAKERLAKEKEAADATSPDEKAPLVREGGLRLLKRLLFAVRRLVGWAVGRGARSPVQIEKERRSAGSHNDLFVEIGYGGRRRRQRPEVPREITDAIVVEVLALVGPDLGNDGEAILCRVARDAPSRLAPAVEELFTGNALANYGRGLLVRLTEAYYLDEEADGSKHYDDGVRRHRAQGLGLHPQFAYYRGPFMALLQTDFYDGVAMLNRLLNHATRVRVRRLAGLGPIVPQFEDYAPGYETKLEITGVRRRYIGDGNVWRWYRGTGVGPYPCFSALQALERVCDEWIKIGTSIRTLASIMLNGCESLAMVSLVIGLLVRHLENADDLLDGYLGEPLIWKHEVARVAHESNGLAAGSEGLVAPERRSWSLYEAAMFMGVRADEKRAVELRALGETLVANARRKVESTREGKPAEADAHAGDSIEQQVAWVRAWASSLDRGRYQAHEDSDGLYIQSTPPDDAVQALQDTNADMERAQGAIRLFGRYEIDRKKEGAEAIAPDALAADVATARNLLETPPSLRVHDPWDTAASVAAAALKAHILEGADLPEDALCFSAETVFRIGEGEACPRPYEFEDTIFEQGADRSAARAVPLLLLPVAARIRAVVDKADGRTAFERAASAGVNLTQAVANEVRLHLARGLDHVWKTPCAGDRRCHHEVGWQFATETMRHCVLGGMDPDTGRGSILGLEEPFTKSLANTDDASILPFRLDAAIRALAPAATANICVSKRARDLLTVLLSAQRRALLSEEPQETDPRGSHTLVSARALLTLAEHDNDTAIYDYIEAYADNSVLLERLLHALSAAAEETPERAATARRIWPKVVHQVLALNGLRHNPFEDHYYGDLALAALMPNRTGEIPFLYREVQDNAILWWEPLDMRPEVEEWMVAAAGRPICVDQLISFLGVLAAEEQARTGLPWVAKLVLADPARVASRGFLLSHWLVRMRSAAIGVGLFALWQQLVDALVVAGVTRLAPYSE